MVERYWGCGERECGFRKLWMRFGMVGLGREDEKRVFGLERLG